MNEELGTNNNMGAQISDAGGSGDVVSFVYESINALSAFGDYPADTDTDTGNSTLPPTRSWVW